MYTSTGLDVRLTKTKRGLTKQPTINDIPSIPSVLRVHVSFKGPYLFEQLMNFLFILCYMHMMICETTQLSKLASQPSKTADLHVVIIVLAFNTLLGILETVAKEKSLYT